MCEQHDRDHDSRHQQGEGGQQDGDPPSSRSVHAVTMMDRGSPSAGSVPCGSPVRVGQTGCMRVYLDHAATTPVLPVAIEAMVPYLADTFGNPSGGHDESRRARRALEDARDSMAALLSDGPAELVFTSGGTEADNLAVVGGWEGIACLRRTGSAPTALVCSAIEHHAVLETCRALARRTGSELREVAVTEDGIVDLDSLAEACTPDVAIVSVMAVNNEIGTIQPLSEIATVVRERSPSALFHTDAVQAVPWLDVREIAAAADLVAISAHKFGGPKGVGALLVRDGAPLRPLLHGGGQERGRRSGTHNVAGVVGAAAALDAIDAGRARTSSRVSALRDRLGDGLLTAVTGCTETAPRERKAPGHLHLRFAGVEAEALVVALDESGVAASAGAACASGAVEPSHVLVAMGLGPDDASNGIRFSLGPATTDDDIDHALAVVPVAVDRLRD